MRPMKDSGVKWIGDVPKGWDVFRIKDIAHIVRGGSPRPIDLFITDGDEYNWIKIGDTIKGDKYIRSKRKIKKAGLSSTRYVHKGELILTNSMSYGEPYLLEIDGCIHDGWVSLSSLKGDKLFIYYSLLSMSCKEQFNIIVDGGVVQNLNIDKIGATKIPLPPLSEQKAIADYLDDQCKHIDEAIQLKQEQLDKLTEYKASVIYEYVTGKKQVL